jgi:DASS family divalent anion:Na+ symporter
MGFALYYLFECTELDNILDTLFWLGGLVMFCEQLDYQGITAFIGSWVSKAFTDVSPTLAAFGLALIYFYSMYMFSSLSGHLIALSGPFLAAGKILKCPPLLLVPLLSYMSALCACLTHYSTGSVVLYAANGHLTSRHILGVGLIVSVFYIVLYFCVGSLWWKVLGWW